MNKEYKIKLDLNKKLYNKKMAFNQFDENVNDFYIEVTKNNEVVKDLNKSIVTLVAIKPDNTVEAQFVEVENGLVYADLKPSMCDLVGNYQAKAMIVLDGKIITTDTIIYSVNEDKIISRLNEDVVSDERFTLFTDALARLSDIEASEEQRIVNEAERILSEENRKIEEAKRVEAELIRQHEEADRAKYDAIRESNENIRKQNENIRLANETNRIDEEAKRVEEENKRKLAEEERNANYNFMTEDEERRRLEANAHKEAEVLRVQAETNRVNEEAKRRTTEQTRVLAENTRVSNENTRKSNEIFRENNETQRIEAETQRQSRYNSFISEAEANANNFEDYTNSAKVKEEERKTNELDRKSQEDKRVSNEVERISNENTRKANEITRESNEATRQNTFTNKVNEVDKKISEINITKDNFISSINTKVDNKISELDTAKSDMTNTVTNKIDEVENRFNALTSKQQQDAEVIDARDGETSLKARLDRDIEKAKQIYVDVEGSHISTDSSSGYLKDVEIKGNTIQDTSNLADIRSVGDKVEGQELYEIPVLSVGKNLFNGNFVQGGIVEATGVLYPDNPALKTSGYIKVSAGKSYVLSSNAYHLHLYDRAFNWIKRIGTKNFTVDVDGYVRFTNSVGITNVQLEEGTVATPYEPYQEDKLTILSPVQLEKVGDVRDRIICKDGVWGVEKNIHTEILGVDNSYNSTSSYVESGYRVVNISNLDYPCVPTKPTLMCNKLKYYNSMPNSTEGITSWSNAQGFIIKLSVNTIGEDSIPAIKEYIVNNNFIVKYPLQTPTFIPLPHDQQVKLRTFANKTNISFLTEIEGTIKAQVPKSLGATVNTHTTQISNLNKELDRVKKLEESTVSTVETESDFTTVEATSNGYFEDVKLEGKTLVNLWGSKSSDFKFSGQTSFNPTTQCIEYTSTENRFSNCFTKNTTQYKPNTKYTLIVNVLENTFTSTSQILKVSSGSGGGADLGVSGDTRNIIGGFIGVQIFTITTLSDLSNSNIAIRTYVDNVDSEVGAKLKFQMIILEGDHTQNPPNGYIEGLKSVGQSTSEDGTDEIVVSSVNGDGNLIDLNNAHSKSCTINNDSIIGTNEYNDVQFYVYLEKGMQYFFNSNGSHEVSGNIMYGMQKSYNASATLQVLKDLKTKPFTFIGETGLYTLHIPNFRGIVKDIQLVKGTTPKLYTPHQSDKKRLLFYNNETQTWEKPILREWDSIEKHADGKYYYHQRSGEVVLSGSENWSLNAGWSGEEMSTNSYYLTADSQKTAGLMVKSNGATNIISEVMPTVFINNTSFDSDCVSGENYTGAICIRINKSKVSNGIKPYLQQNPMRVVYQLAQEKVYECTNIDLITYANETNYIVESGAIVPKTTLKVHNNISNVVSLLQKKVSLLESNITKYMITQNRMQLASTYSADSVTFKVDYTLCSEETEEYNEDLYNLILNNILVGKDNYDYDKMFTMILDYASWNQISWEQFDILVGLMDIQHNPPIEEIPTDDEIVEEIPNEIM